MVDIALPLGSRSGYVASLGQVTPRIHAEPSGAALQIITYSVQSAAPPFPAFIIFQVLNGIGLALQVRKDTDTRPCLEVKSTILGRTSEWLRRRPDLFTSDQDGHPACSLR